MPGDGFEPMTLTYYSTLQLQCLDLRLLPRPTEWGVTSINAYRSGKTAKPAFTAMTALGLQYGAWSRRVAPPLEYREYVLILAQRHGVMGTPEVQVFTVLPHDMPLGEVAFAMIVADILEGDLPPKVQAWIKRLFDPLVHPVRPIQFQSGSFGLVPFIDRIS